MKRKENVINRCEYCGSIVSPRYIDIYKELLVTLWSVYMWCCKHNRHEFVRKEIKHLFKSESDIARFGDLILFGGLVYRPGKRGSYGLNMTRCEQFFCGALSIPCTIVKDPITKQVTPAKYAYIHTMQGLKDLLSDNEQFCAMYAATNRGFRQLPL